MKKTKRLLSALTALAITASAFAGFAIPASAESANNSVAINETFDSGVTTGEGYVWDVATTANWNGGTGEAGKQGTLSTSAVSLSDNKDKQILTFANGIGGPQKDVEISFDAGSGRGFGQAACEWYITFKSTDNTELFKLQLQSGGWAFSSSLIVGDNKQLTNYTFAETQMTSVSAYVSFAPNGGTVTFGNVSADFAAGSDIGSITVTTNGVSDQGRPFIMDDFIMNTVNKQLVTFNISSSESGQSVAGAKLIIDEDEYVVPESGTVEAYYLPGTHSYGVQFSRHRAIADVSFNITADATNNVPVELEYLGEPVPTSIVIGGGSEYIYKKMMNDSSSEPFTATVYDNAGLVMDNVGVEWSLAGQPDTISVDENGVVTVTPDYMLTDDNGVDVTVRATVPGTEVKQDATIHIRNVARVGSFAVAGPAVVKDGVKTDFTIVDVKDQYGNDYEMETASHTFTDVREQKATVIRAYYSDGNISKIEAENDVAVTGGSCTVVSKPIAGLEEKVFLWDSLSGMRPLAPAAEMAVIGAPTYTMTSTDEKAVISGLGITTNVGTSRSEEVTITVSLDGASNPVTATKTVEVYGYDFYEPGVGEASYGKPRMEVVNDVNSIVWPKSASANSSTTITLPTPVELAPSTAKMITFDNIATTKVVGSQERSLSFVNSEGKNVISIDFAGSSVVTGWSKVDGNYTGTEIGKLNAIGVSSSATFLIKTDADGVSSAVLSYNGSTLAEYTLENAGDIAAIKLGAGAGAPDDRLLTLTNIIISDSNVPEVEIIGDDKIAKISGIVASKKFKGSVFSKSEGETFTWSVADEQGSPIDGVTIDAESGVLSVTDAVAADTVAVISYTSSLSTEASPKCATHKITIKDFAAVQSFEIDGPVAVNAGETVTYAAKNVVDEYGDKVTMPVSFAITEGSDIASINAETGEVTTSADKLGSYTVSVTVGNPGKTSVLTTTATVAKYSEIGEGTGSVVVDVTKLANYAVDTQYLVTTATAEGVLVNQTETASTDGKVTVDLTAAAKYEVSPIYTYDNVGDVSGGKDIPVCDGRYEFKFVKANMTRGDIYVNGIMVGNNVDQDGKGKTPAASSPEWVVDDVLVQGGKATVTMKDNTSEMKSIEVRKNPSILERKTHLYILGDSLVADYHKTFDYSTGNKPVAGDAQTGWGQVLHEFISDDINVTNLAESGNYAKGLYSPAFAGALASAEAGDYIIIECGYNDANYSSESEMKEYLEKMADDCEAKGVTIIMSGPNFGPARGDTNSGSAKFTGGVLASAEAKGVLGINLSAAGKAYYEAKGWTSEYWSQNFNCYYDGAVQDNLHLSYHGAMLHASLIAQAISDAQNDTENTELAASLAGLKLDKTAKTLTDSTGATLTFQVQ